MAEKVQSPRTFKLALGIILIGGIIMYGHRQRDLRITAEHEKNYALKQAEKVAEQAPQEQNTYSIWVPEGFTAQVHPNGMVMQNSKGLYLLTRNGTNETWLYDLCKRELKECRECNKPSVRQQVQKQPEPQVIHTHTVETIVLEAEAPVKAQDINITNTNTNINSTPQQPMQPTYYAQPYIAYQPSYSYMPYMSYGYSMMGHGGGLVIAPTLDITVVRNTVQKTQGVIGQKPLQPYTPTVVTGERGNVNVTPPPSYAPYDTRVAPAGGRR